MGNTKEAAKLLVELEKRKKWEFWKENPKNFFEDCLKIYPKDASLGLISLKLNSAQQRVIDDFEQQMKDTGYVRSIISKYRQAGFSTVASAYIFHRSLFFGNTRSVVISLDKPTTESIFSMSQTFWNELPKEIQPELDKSNVREMSFQKNGSKYRVWTAGAETPGRGTTNTCLLADEAAFWQNGERILAGMFQSIALLPGSIIIINSTSNGAQGVYYDLWNKAEKGEGIFKPLFVPWFLQDEYRLDAPEGMELTPEEKLLRAIFGEKAGDVRDTSLRVPPGVTGTVIGARVFARKGVEKDERALQIEEQEESRLLKDQKDEVKIIVDSGRRKINALVTGKATVSRLVDDRGDVILEKDVTLDPENMAAIRYKYLSEIRIGDDEVEDRIDAILESADERVALVKLTFSDKIARLKKGDELAPGVIKMVKVYVAIKRRLQVGDKMAGRHGNKGVISRVLPVEDMPYTVDGRPVDICLNPLGVPSRMNIGQILETHLGWGAKQVGRRLEDIMEQHFSSDVIKAELKKFFDHEKDSSFIDSLDVDEVRKLAGRLQRGIHFATPVFEGAREIDIDKVLEQAGVATSGQSVLFDGRTGEPFDQPVTVGVMYMLKLHHLVDDKIHARSIGPYSLVTQQPLGGKAQFGGQRLGEMEVWAMEAYGAAYALQEFLTVKSDDVQGRTRMYEAIVKGENTLESGIPESFNVLTKELQALCLDVQMIQTDDVLETAS